ncbi:ATP-binding protein [Romboutsia ilealis]|uniref:ATP-binding protein n=1 Tax=Romboutsia ilealis TaxID=1115758 RepID=UPI0027149D0A|nr:ATP-binding protein [Romboutsia ilealis]
MKAINIYTYSRIQKDMATEFENILSKRSKKLKVKPQEFYAIRSLVNMLLGIGVEIKDFENFFLSFTIEQIGKEFDLIKLDKDNLVLNIELKSEEVGVEAIQNQLEKNRYYLKHLAPDVRLYTFVETGKELYKYTSKGLQLVGVEDLKDTMQLFQESLGENLESLFQANSYLISPLNSYQKFMYGDYFLTNQQHDLKKKIVDLILLNDKEYVLGITGKAGTGKTLLLYDIIKEIAERGENCCLIHSGILCDGHRILSAKWENVIIFSAKELNGDGVENLKRYQFIFVDESQRIYSSTFEKIIKEVISESKTVIFAYDYAQSLSITEEERNIPAKLQKIDGFVEYTLSDKIRTSKEIASFTRTMMNLNNRARGYMDYSDIDVLFANNTEEAKRLINLYDEKGYIFISYTQSMYNRNSIDLYPSNYDTHHVIGQEYDKVMIMMDKNFRYDKERRIQGKEHPNPDLLFYKLLYQGISRAREKLCVLIVENYKLFSDILNIKFDMLSRYQYKENNTNITLSVKKLNRLTKSIKDKLSEVHDNYSLTISETVDMINDELMGAELKKKVIRNGIKLLKIIQNELVSEEIYELISKYCDYVEETTRTANTELCLLGD